MRQFGNRLFVWVVFIVGGLGLIGCSALAGCGVNQPRARPPADRHCSHPDNHTDSSADVYTDIRTHADEYRHGYQYRDDHTPATQHRRLAGKN